MPIDIDPAHLAIVGDILQRYVPEREVWAFGSRVAGTAKRASDLDLAILGDEPLAGLVLADLRDAFSESLLPFKVDIVEWATTTDVFRRIIERQRVVLQPGQPARALA